MTVTLVAGAKERRLHVPRAKVEDVVSLYPVDKADAHPSCAEKAIAVAK